MSAKMIALLQRAIRFLLMGAMAFLVYLTVMWTLLDKMGQPPAFGATVAFILATGVSYVVNTVWAFQVQINGSKTVRLLIMMGLGLLVNLNIACMLGHMDFSYAFISVSVFIIVPIIIFLGHQLWTFHFSRPKLGT